MNNSNWYYIVCSVISVHFSSSEDDLQYLQETILTLIDLEKTNSFDHGLEEMKYNKTGPNQWLSEHPHFLMKQTTTAKLL